MKEKRKEIEMRHIEAVEMLKLIHQRKQQRAATKMDTIYQKQALKVLSPSLNKNLFSVGQRL